MPLFTYFCDSCGNKMTDDDTFKCKCGGTFRLNGGANIIEPFAPYWSENLGEHPIYVTSRSMRRKILKEKGLEILPDNPNKRRPNAMSFSATSKPCKMTLHEKEKARWRNFFQTPRDVMTAHERKIVDAGGTL